MAGFEAAGVVVGGWGETNATGGWAGTGSGTWGRTGRTGSGAWGRTGRTGRGAWGGIGRMGSGAWGGIGRMGRTGWAAGVVPNRTRREKIKF